MSVLMTSAMSLRNAECVPVAYGLTPHPTKTRLVPFERPPLGGTRNRTTSASFDLLGFTHYWARSRGMTWVITRKTAKDRLARALGRIAEWCSDSRHRPIAMQRAALAKKLRGHYEYYGITGNSRSLSIFYERVRSTWRLWLSRRSNNSTMTFEQLDRVLKKRPLPRPLLKRKYA